MPERGLSGAERQTSVRSSKDESVTFVGISLSGGKADKTCIAVLEYFPSYKKIFLTKVIEKIKTEAAISADYKVIQAIDEIKQNLKSVAFDVPIKLPKCVECKLVCPGYEVCPEEEMKWFRDFYRPILKDKKPKKIFTPYTQRCVDSYITHSMDEKFDMHHALGANLAPLTARAIFLQRRISVPCIEVYPPLSLWRLGLHHKISKTLLRTYKQSATGLESRRLILNKLIDKDIAFIYKQDAKSMTENSHALDAFICGYTAFMKYLEQTEPRPKNFPKAEAWIEIPKFI